MDDYEISEVAKILSEWNPLGDYSQRVKDLDDYKTEAVDILFHLETGSKKTDVGKVIMQVLNEAFNIQLTENECFDAANKIVDVLGRKL